MGRNIPSDAIAQRPDGDFEIDSAVVAKRMRMSVAHFMAELRRGNVVSLVEKGHGEDEGRYRLSFRYGGRHLRVIVGGDGRLIEEIFDFRKKKPPPATPKIPC